MRLSQFLAAAAAVSLAATPAVSAPTNPAAKLSLASQAAATTPAEEPRRRNPAFILIGVGVLVVVLAALAMGGDGDSKPASA